METKTFTYQTIPDGKTHLVHSAEKAWLSVELSLMTAGPVVFGTDQELSPVLSGRGNLLSPSGEPKRMLISKGQRLYIAAEAVNQVTIILQPIPFMATIIKQLDSGFSGLKGIFGSTLRALQGGKS